MRDLDLPRGETNTTGSRFDVEQDLKREYQEFLQEHKRGRSDSDGSPDRDEHEIRDWAREHDLPYFDRHPLRLGTAAR